MKFTSKVAVRNLFRYKKRFFMTIFGIGGCTALVVFAFGLTDSISGVAHRQYDELFHYDMTLTLDDNADEADMDELYDFLSHNNGLNAGSVYQTAFHEYECQGQWRDFVYSLSDGA